MPAAYDLTLVIRARDEATRAFKSLAGGLHGLERSLSGAGRRVERFGANVSQVGQGLSAFSLPILGVGIAAGKMAMDFESAMAKIVGLVGVSREQVDAWRDDLIKMGPEVGKTPQELAEALYFVTSSGIDLADALEVVRVAARASSSGMGEAAVLADALTSAMNAYGSANLSAAKAADIMAAAVKFGKLEADALAPVLGRLLPVASSLGIGFEQVAGALAVMSRTGLDASEAAASLNAIMIMLMKPSMEGAKALADVGLSMGGLRDMVAKPGGLIEVLRLLNTKLGKNKEEFNKVVSTSEALRGVMNILAQDASSVDKVMVDVANSTGIADEAFKAASETASFKMNAAISQLKGLLIDVGAEILPLATAALENLVGWLKRGAEWFKSLSPEVRKTIVTMGLLVGVLGPAIFVLGKVTSGVGALIKVVAAVPAAFSLAAKGIAAIPAFLGLLTGPIGLVITAIGALALAWATNFGGIRDTLEPVVKAVGDALGQIGERVNDFIEFLGFPRIKIGAEGPPESRLRDLGKEIGRTISPIVAGIELASPSVEETNKIKANITRQISPIMAEVELVVPKIEAIGEARLEILPPDTSAAEQAMAESSQRLEESWAQTGQHMGTEWDATWARMRPVMERRGAELLMEQEEQGASLQFAWEKVTGELGLIWEKGLGQVKESNKVSFDAIDMDIQGRMLGGEAIIKAGLALFQGAWSVGLGLLEGITTGRFGALNQIIGDLMGDIGRNLGEAWANIMANITAEWNAWLANIRTAWDNFRQFMAGGQRQAGLPPEVPIIPRVFGISAGPLALPRLSQTIEATRAPLSALNLPPLNQRIRLLRDKLADLALPPIQQVVSLVRNKLPNLTLPNLKQSIRLIREKVPDLRLPALNQKLALVRDKLPSLILPTLQQAIRLSRERIPDLTLPVLRQVVRLVRERLPGISLPPLAQAIRAERQPLPLLRLPRLNQLVEMVRGKLPDLALSPLRQAVTFLRNRVPPVSLSALRQRIEMIRGYIPSLILPSLRQVVHMARERLLPMRLPTLSQAVRLMREQISPVALPTLMQPVRLAQAGQLSLQPIRADIAPMSLPITKKSPRWAEMRYASVGGHESQTPVNVTFTGNIYLPSIHDPAEFERWARQQGLKAASIRRSPGR